MSEYNVGDKVRIVQNIRYSVDPSQSYIGKVCEVLHRTRVSAQHMVYQVALPEAVGGRVTCHSTELQPASALDAAAQELRDANKALQSAREAITSAEARFEAAREALAVACLVEVQP